MPRITINRDKCKGCLLCVSACPQGLIVVEEGFNLRGVKPVKFKSGGKCAGCALCALMCPDCCIEVYK
ncbi:MAG: 4Fe-4S dicluster domain-containing protein [Candidatus Omnitrophota bacterium]|nr:4Fe-4S dicluster domain-containing protein [Candidatus Omnitrophota bacterium]MDD5517807.1 4Fe-4S dicluster domain-containing protein [Candidatus Omnitrophota bacterium]